MQLVFWGTILLRGNVTVWVWKRTSFAGIADKFVMHLNFFLEKFVLSHKRYLLNLNFRRLISIWWEGSVPVQCFSIKKELTQFKQVLILANGTIFEWYRNYVILTATTTKKQWWKWWKILTCNLFLLANAFFTLPRQDFSQWKKLEDYSTSWFYFYSTSKSYFRCNTKKMFSLL